MLFIAIALKTKTYCITNSKILGNIKCTNMVRKEKIIILLPKC